MIESARRAEALDRRRIMKRPFEDEYRATTYRVYAPGGDIDLQIDRISPALDALLAQHDVSSWAFVTAWNPHSQPLGAGENAARSAELVRAVQAQGWRYIEGAGIPQREGWPPEASLLVLGITKEEALALARVFGQNAIVAGTRGTAGELAYCV